MRSLQWALVAASAAAVVACSSDGSGDVSSPQEKVATGSSTIQTAPTAMQNELSSAVFTVNGRKVVVGTAEYLTSGESDEMGNLILFNSRGNKQLNADFVPYLDGCLDGTTDISYYIDLNRPSLDLPVATTEAAIGRAMHTWSTVPCATLPIGRIPSDPSISTGFISKAAGYGGSYNYIADIVHCGWLPASFFEAVRPGGGTSTLGITFTLFFADENGDLVDFDKNGKWDVAFREIYYNDGFTWKTNGQSFDVEWVALHEAGHGLSQQHFGKAFFTVKNETWHFAPFAVMNAVYSGRSRRLQPTDEAGHCSIWANWPNR